MKWGLRAGTQPRLLLFLSTHTHSLPRQAGSGKKAIYSIYFPWILATGRSEESLGHIFPLLQDSEEAGRVKRTYLDGLEDALDIIDHLLPERGGKARSLGWHWRPAAGPKMASSSLLKMTGQTEGFIQGRAEQLSYILYALPAPNLRDLYTYVGTAQNELQWIFLNDKWNNQPLWFIL